MSDAAETGSAPLDSEREYAAWARERLEVWALVRTAFSSERSVLAWMRTATAFYSFGFAITKFLDYVGGANEGDEFEGLRWLGAALICAGLYCLGAGIGDHLWRLRTMRALGLPSISRFSLPVCFAAILFTLGLVLLIGIGLSLEVP